MVKQNREGGNLWKEKREDAINFMKISFAARSENEGFARVAAAAFLTQLDPTLEEVEDVKTAVSEAVTNSIIHGYAGCEKTGEVLLEACLTERSIHIRIADKGVGIADVRQAMEPLFTTKPELERSGMGFAFMEAFMDELYVESRPQEGTVVYMSKQINGE